MLLTPGDELSEVIPLADAAALAGVSDRTVRRWVEAGHLTVLPGRFVTKRAVLECERDRSAAARRGRPGARPPAV